MSAPALPHCEVGQNIVACYGARDIHRRQVMRCPTCERRTPFVVSWGGAWYGTTDYCTVCLDYWQDEWRGPRPFQRRDRAALIRRMWDTAMLPDEYKKWTRFDVHRATCDVENCTECEARP